VNDLALAATTFALVIPAELPDKTFISTLVMAARHQPWPVWIGAAAALVVQAGIGSAAGRLLDLAPHELVEIVVTAAFLLGALYLLVVNEHVEADRAATLAAREDGTGPSAISIGLKTFGIVALAEFGDLTQVLVANLSARYHQPYSVFAGAAVGFVIVSGFGVLAGRSITRLVPLGIVRKIAGLALLGFGIWNLVTLL
jgi:putative Ca2+/H+ antiporter (TMEM165/GDT1 family)